MAEEASFPAGHRLSDDLRRIREDRGITIDEIHSETRIARTLIESFEEGQLYDHPTYNRVYLRSFLKAYADAIEIPREKTLRALDAALEGTYQHELAQEYLSGEPADLEPTPEEQEEDEASASASSEAPPGGPTAGGPEGRGGIVGPPRAVGEEPDEAEIPMDDPPDDAATESSPSSATSDESDEEDGDGMESASAPEEETPDDDASPAGGVDEKPSADAPSTDDAATEEAPSDEDASEEEPDEPETTDASASDAVEESAESDEPDASDMTGPEALRSSPDEDDETESDDRDEPSWLEEEPSDDSAADVPDPSAADAPASASMEGEVGSGIVGEPAEMGSGESGSPTGAARPSGPTSARSTASESTLTDLLRDPSRRIVVTGIGIAVVLLVLVGLGVAYFSSGSETPEASPSDTTAAATTPPPTDTSVAVPADTAADTTSAEQRPPPADVTLGETISLLVLATDNVSGLRVQRDDDLRRPYWIEEGEASVFPFQRRAIIGSEFEDIRLFVEGYEYPFSPADTAGGLDLTRETLQAFVDTLRGEPNAPEVATDTIPVGPIEGAAPPPEDTTEAASPSE